MTLKSGDLGEILDTARAALSMTNTAGKNYDVTRLRRLFLGALPEDSLRAAFK